jgi:branched-chain amino acid transport system substrate-binding protein
MEKGKIKLIVLFLIGIAVGAIISYVSMAYVLQPAKEEEIVTWRIGAAVELSGALATWGTEGQVGARIAVDDMNELLSRTGSRIRFELIVLDTKTIPEECLKVVQYFHETYGIKVVVGPYTSGEVGAIKSYVDMNKICVLAISTSPLLSVPDYIFRYMAPDHLGAKGYAKLLWELGYRKVAIIYRKDAWGEGYNSLFTQIFQKLGGTVRSLGYTIDLPDYASEVAALSGMVQELGVDNQTAVFYVVFETDGVNILNHALRDDVLNKVRWFLSDSVLTDALYPPKGSKDLADYLVGKKAMGLRIRGIKSALTQIFLDKYKAYGGPGTGEKGAWLYDCTWIAMLSMLAAGKYDGEAIAKVIPKISAFYSGATGPCMVDENGDRAIQTYTVYTLGLEEGTYKFIDIGTYDSATDTLSFY